MLRGRINITFDDGIYAVTASTDGHRLEIKEIRLLVQGERSISVHPTLAIWAAIEKHCRREIIGKVIAAAPAVDIHNFKEAAA